MQCCKFLNPTLVFFKDFKTEAIVPAHHCEIWLKSENHFDFQKMFQELILNLMMSSPPKVRVFYTVKLARAKLPAKAAGKLIRR